LNFPNLTVSHADSVPGRNWNIAFPQDIRNCEQCHPAGTSSGTWATNPNRLACGGCHDSLAAQSHITSMINDPTPNEPFNGDETEACQTCHAP
jgi:hypothetical protein